MFLKFLRWLRHKLFGIEYPIETIQFDIVYDPTTFDWPKNYHFDFVEITDQELEEMRANGDRINQYISQQIESGEILND